MKVAGKTMGIFVVWICAIGDARAESAVLHKFDCFEDPLAVVESRFMVAPVGIARPELTRTARGLTTSISKLWAELFLMEQINRKPSLHSDWRGFPLTLQRIQEASGSVSDSNVRPSELELASATNAWRLVAEKSGPMDLIQSELGKLNSISATLDLLQTVALMQQRGRVDQGKRSSSVYLMVFGHRDIPIDGAINSARVFYSLDGTRLARACSSSPVG